MAQLRIVGGNVEIYEGSELTPILTLDRDTAAAGLLRYFGAAVMVEKRRRSATETPSSSSATAEGRAS